MPQYAGVEPTALVLFKEKPAFPIERLSPEGGLCRAMLAGCHKATSRNRNKHGRTRTLPAPPSMSTAVPPHTGRPRAGLRECLGNRRTWSLGANFQSGAVTVIPPRGGGLAGPALRKAPEFWRVGPGCAVHTCHIADLSPPQLGIYRAPPLYQREYFPLNPHFTDEKTEARRFFQLVSGRART